MTDTLPAIWGQAGQGLNNVTAPFDPKYWPNITQAFGVNGEQGVDIGMPQGTPVRAVADGCVHLNTNWTIPGKPVGYAALMKLTNGWSALYGHITRFNVKDGQCVHGGDIIGWSGGTPGTPGAGDSTGPHIEFQLIKPGGGVVNPADFLGVIFHDTNAVVRETQTGNAQVSNLPLPSVPGLDIGGFITKAGIIILGLLLIGFALYVLFRGGSSGKAPGPIAKAAGGV